MDRSLVVEALTLDLRLKPALGEKAMAILDGSSGVADGFPDPIAAAAAVHLASCLEDDERPAAQIAQLARLPEADVNEAIGALRETLDITMVI